ncbi:MAG: S1C family serine protease [Sphingomicrobium sp.]
MSDASERAFWSRPRTVAILAGTAIVAAVAGALLTRSIPSGPKAQAQPRRPIVQIVRPQPGLPSLADTIARLCPSIASIVPGPANSGQGVSGGVPAFVISADGWLVTTATLQSAAHMHAVFGDGSEADISEVRVDPISGLAIAKTTATGLTPLNMDDQAFPRVGDFGFALQAPSGNGCSAQIAMIGSDFLADGGGPVSYVRVQPTTPAIPAGAPYLDSDGDGVAVSISDPTAPDAMLPAAIAGIVVDELIRGSPSPSIAFGFRATDFAAALADRLSDARLRGAGVAIVQKGSSADKAGLHAGDVVVAVGNSPVSSASELGRALDASQKVAALQVMRGDKRLQITVTRSDAAGPAQG